MQFATEQPEMCQFLIDNGADVDEIGRDFIHAQFFRCVESLIASYKEADVY
jgi:hypothetical protein